MSSAALKWWRTVRRSCGTLAGQLVLHDLCWDHRGGVCVQEVNVSALAREIGMGRRSVQRALADLEEAGFLSRFGRMVRLDIGLSGGAQVRHDGAGGVCRDDAPKGVRHDGAGVSPRRRGCATMAQKLRHHDAPIEERNKKMRAGACDAQAAAPAYAREDGREEAPNVSQFSTERRREVAGMMGLPVFCTSCGEWHRLDRECGEEPRVMHG